MGNLSASAVFFGLVTGLLAMWLYITMSGQQHNDYRVLESSVSCDKARSDTAQAERFGKVSDAVLSREKAACGDAAVQVGQRVVAEEKNRKESDELKKSIEKALQPEGQEEQ